MRALIYPITTKSLLSIIRCLKLEGFILNHDTDSTKLVVDTTGTKVLSAISRDDLMWSVRVSEAVAEMYSLELWGTIW